MSNLCSCLSYGLQSKEYNFKLYGVKVIWKILMGWSGLIAVTFLHCPNLILICTIVIRNKCLLLFMPKINLTRSDNSVHLQHFKLNITMERWPIVGPLRSYLYRTYLGVKDNFETVNYYLWLRVRTGTARSNIMTRFYA